MNEYKEMRVRKPRTGKMPVLDLNGKWLSDLGFTIGTLIYANFNNSCLTLSTDEISGSNVGVLVVKGKKMRGSVRPVLPIDWLILKRFGYHNFDRVGLTLSPHMIQITKINRFTVGEYAY